MLIIFQTTTSSKHKVKEVIYNTLNKNKIEIPFPQRDVYVRHVEMPTQKAKTKKLEPETIETEPEIVKDAVETEEKKKAPRKRHRKPKKKEE